jgi:hypothetical protein
MTEITIPSLKELDTTDLCDEQFVMIDYPVKTPNGPFAKASANTLSNDQFHILAEAIASENDQKVIAQGSRYAFITLGEANADEFLAVYNQRYGGTFSFAPYEVEKLKSLKENGLLDTDYNAKYENDGHRFSGMPII